jgi:hypothetical protein
MVKSEEQGPIPPSMMGGDFGSGGEVGDCDKAGIAAPKSKKSRKSLFMGIFN